MRKIGFLINPVAGIGGKVGLKGSDGAETLNRALALGARPEAGEKAKIALRRISPAREIQIVTYPGEMGEDIAGECGFSTRVLGKIENGRTTPEDTLRAARALRDEQVELILFAGGDGTARNILDAVGMEIPVLGIPAGCKIHSGVYAVNPRMAGDLVTQYLNGTICGTREAEVMDIDEALFRLGVVNARLYGYLRVPNEYKMVQNLKSGRGLSEAGTVQLLSNYIADSMRDDTLYIIGSGSTMQAVMNTLQLPGTLLGIDLVYQRGLLAADVTEAEILRRLDQYPKAEIVVTVIGGQGYVFGRGNQQISGAVIRRVGKENIRIAASKAKMLSLLGQSLYVDTGDEEVNRMLRGYYRVIVGYDEYHVFKMTDGT